jgi:Fe-S-cluster containining protein
VDAAAWLDEHATVRADPDRFACLDGCGFCCTYPPQVTQPELAELEDEAEIPTVGVDREGGMHLPLQGDCGGCTLLEDRRCTAYEARPMHCRLFPFHVYLGRRVEVYANQVCPGLDPDPDRFGEEAEQAEGVAEALDRALPAAREDDLERKHEDAIEAYDAFEANAREADVWAPPEPAVEAAVDEARVTRQAWQAALTPYRVEDDEALPTMVLPREGFPWRAWRLGDHTFTVYRFDETGTLEPVDRVPEPSIREPVPEPAHDVLERLAGYACFVGNVFDRVDHARYDVHVRDAAVGEANEVLAELTVRARLLDAADVPVTPRWLAAAYEPAFFDRPTIGAWL